MNINYISYEIEDGNLEMFGQYDNIVDAICSVRSYCSIMESCSRTQAEFIIDIQGSGAGVLPLLYFREGNK